MNDRPDPADVRTLVFDEMRLFAQKSNIDDLRASSQNVFNAGLMAIGHSYFRNHKEYFIDDTNNYNDLSYAKYDYIYLNEIYDIYNSLCMYYDKIPTYKSFEYLTGVNPEHVVKAYRAGINQGSSPGMLLFVQNAGEAREEALSAKLTSGAKNPIGIIAALNHWHGWNDPQTARDGADAIEYKPSDKLPDLSNGVSLLSDNRDNFTD